MYLDKAYIIVKRNVETNRNTNIQIICKLCFSVRLMSKGEYLIVPKGTKFMGSGKLGLEKKKKKTFFFGGGGLKDQNFM